MRSCGFDIQLHDKKVQGEYPNNNNRRASNFNQKENRKTHNEDKILKEFIKQGGEIVF